MNTKYTVNNDPHALIAQMRDFAKAMAAQRHFAWASVASRICKVLEDKLKEEERGLTNERI